ncbi:bifunctional phosphoribosylaminoimidazolecarboxamide formyltransferase/IMP cyclohydrolase [Bdellovibrionota bacterium FG-2]
MSELKIQRALLSVSDKAGVVELATALAESGTELVATGKTAAMLKAAGLSVVSIEEISGSPEAFNGRMKTLSFGVCSGILFRRGDAQDEEDAKRLSIRPIDCVVVNFYPFEEAKKKPGITPQALIEEVDIGGPTLVRAAAKNVPHVLVLSAPGQYAKVISELRASKTVSVATVKSCASEAWDVVAHYDSVISETLGKRRILPLRYGENPHQSAHIEISENPPLDWAAASLSYNNILDLSAAYHLVSELKGLDQNQGQNKCEGTSVVILKHNNPCGVAWVPKTQASAQKAALIKAWEGDPVSAFGGVVVFSDPLENETAQWLSEKFVDVVAAPEFSLNSPERDLLLKKRKNLKAVEIFRFGEQAQMKELSIPGGRLVQAADLSKGNNSHETLEFVTNTRWPETFSLLARFGIKVCATLKSNALALVREAPGIPGSLQVIGAGQGQPNRVDALRILAIPRAQAVLRESGGTLGDALLVSDGFFPFRDSVEVAHSAGITRIVQPGGSLRDQESVAACNEFGMAMAFTGVRHFLH